MAKQIARLLKADIQETSDLKSIAKMLSKKGRGGDTMLAHITPKEASILKEAGGAGTVNPDTGLLEFYDWSGGSYVDDSYYSAAPSVSQPYMDTSAFEGIGETYTAPTTYDWSGAPSVSPETLNISAVAPAATDYTPDVSQYATGMFDLPAGMAREGAPAIQATGVRPDVLATTVKQPGLIETAKGYAKEYVAEPFKALQEATGLSGSDLIRLGGAGAGAIAGRAQSQKAAQQIQQAVQEQKQVGQPYQKAGQELQRAAMAGELTPQSAQAYQALQAQMRQGIEARGGVGVAQAQAQMEAFRQNLLQNQFNFGLQVSQIGDNMALGAIRTGMQLDQQLAAANQQFYTQLAAIAGGGTYQAPRGQ